MFFDARLVEGEPDVTYGAADLAALGGAVFADGAASGDALAITPDAGMTVRVAPGAAFIRGRAYVLDSEKTLSLEASGDAPRFDLAVLRLDLGAREIVPAVLTGIPAADPVPPTPTDEGGVTEIPLAKIGVPAGAQSAAACSVADLRPFAAIRSMEAPIAAAVGEAIEALDLPDDGDVAALRALVRRVRTDGAGAKALCDDGVYRAVGVLERVELARYDRAGEYEFDPAECPSANGLYDVEVIGGGGSGASILGEGKRGGGGGAGAHVTVCSLRLGDTVAVAVGAGGVSAPGYDGMTGGESRFGSVFAAPGEGGTRTTGGLGGETAQFRGADGFDGTLDARSLVSLDDCGAGAPSAFGPGGYAGEHADVAMGDRGHGAGSGGSGSGGPEQLAEVLAGGRGADGAVIVFGYRAPEGE